jgi:hypothetical protein
VAAAGELDQLVRAPVRGDRKLPLEQRPTVGQELRQLHALVARVTLRPHTASQRTSAGGEEDRELHGRTPMARRAGRTSRLSASMVFCWSTDVTWMVTMSAPTSTSGR